MSRRLTRGPGQRRSSEAGKASDCEARGEAPANAVGGADSQRGVPSRQAEGRTVPRGRGLVRPWRHDALPRGPWRVGRRRGCVTTPLLAHSRGPFRPSPGSARADWPPSFVWSAIASGRVPPARPSMPGRCSCATLPPLARPGLWLWDSRVLPGSGAVADGPHSGRPRVARQGRPPTAGQAGRPRRTLVVVRRYHTSSTRRLLPTTTWDEIRSAPRR